MQPCRISSHLYAEEYLLVRRPNLYQEILNLLSECEAKPTRRSKGHSWALRRHIGERFRRLARQRGWSETTLGLKKKGVVMMYYCPPYPAPVSFQDVVGSRFINYAMGEIDVAVEIFPRYFSDEPSVVKSVDQTGFLGFEEAVAVIDRFGRASPSAPMLVIEVMAQRGLSGSEQRAQKGPSRRLDPNGHRAVAGLALRFLSR